MYSLSPVIEGVRPTSSGGRTLPTVTVGFIPLTDCAVLAVAREQGFAAREGVDLQLVREVSWANIRDKVALGHLSGAQMLAGMPIAAALGINQARTRMIAPFCLNRNGNAISVSNELYSELSQQPEFARGVTGSGEALQAVISKRRAEGAPPLTFGVVYPFSCHNYELRYWMAACGIDPEVDVRLLVIPPPLMVDSLRRGYVDGFCVGEPWNSLAVEADLGRIIVCKAELWRYGVEKVLCLPESWVETNKSVLAALIRALDRAAAWAEQPDNWSKLATILAAPAYLDLPEAIIERALTGKMIVGPGLAPRTVSDFLVLHRDRANEPSVAQALWIYAQMIRWGQTSRQPGDEKTVRAVFRPDIYRAALENRPWETDPPETDRHPTVLESGTFFDSRIFDPAQIDSYLAHGIGPALPNT